MLRDLEPLHGKSRRILVTGAAGFIGSHTVDLLLRDGYQVLGIDNLSTGKRQNLASAFGNPRFQFAVRDLLDPGVLDYFTAGFQPDAIIHLAGLVSVALGQRAPQENFRLNIEATKVVAESARIHGVPRVVFASTAAVYGDSQELPLDEHGFKDPKSNYGTAKLMSELLLHGYARSYGMTCICCRYFNVFGPRQDPASPYSGVISIFVDRFMQGRAATIFGDGGQSRDFVSVYDIARGNVLAATRPDLPSGSYNLCTGHSIRLLDVVDLLEREFPYAPAVRFAEERSGDIRHSRGNPQRARVALGFEAERTFDEAMRDLLAKRREELAPVTAEIA